MLDPAKITGFRETALVGAAMLLLVHLLYSCTMHAGLVTDFTGMQERLDGASFWDFIDCFGFPALQQVNNFFLYIFHQLFEQNGLPWYLVHTSMHVLNGVLGYHLGKKIFAQSGFESPRSAAFIGSLFFMLSPYQAEVIVWKVCFNYLLSTACTLGSLLYMLRYFESKKQHLFWWSNGLFIVGLFTFELAMIVPFVSVVFLYIRQYYLVGSAVEKNAKYGGSSLNKFGAYIILQFALLAGYFGLNKIILGSWVGHYGASTHLNFNIAEISANLLKYFSKYLCLWREWSGPMKQQWMALCESEMVAYGALAIGAVIVIAGAYFFKKINNKLQAAWLCWLLFFIALLPVANLYAPWLLHGENDRYGYLASLFFYLGLVSLFNFLPKILRYPLLILGVCISIFYLNKITSYWQQSATVFNSLLDDFRWEDSPEIYVLAMPENLKGIPMFKDFSGEDLALHHALLYGRKKRIKGKIYQVAQFNLAKSTDGVSVVADSTNHFQIKFDQWRNWWWRNGIGTGSYETDKYKFKTLKRGSEIWIKEPVEGAVFIYSKGGLWEEVFSPQ